MENPDARTILFQVSQDKPGSKAWCEDERRSPDFIRFMEQVEVAQQRLAALSRSNNSGLRNVPTSTFAANGESYDSKRASASHRRLRFSEASDHGHDAETTVSRPERLMHAVAQYRSARTAEQTRAARVTSPDTHDARYVPRTRSPVQREVSPSGAPSTRYVRALDFSTISTSHFEAVEERQSSAVSMRRIQPELVRSFHHHRTSAHSAIDLESEDDDAMTFHDSEDQEDIDHDSSPSDVGRVEDDIDASERLALELMEAEEREFLERLHQEQQMALERLRATGADVGEAWLDAEDDTAEGEESQEMDYDALLELGERLGDVKTERWRQRSSHVAAELPKITFANMKKTLPMYKDELCVICQFDFEADDELKLMPHCTHAFHTDCADAWIKDHDRCATCKAQLEQEQ